MIVQRESEAFKVRFYGGLVCVIWAVCLGISGIFESADQALAALRMLAIATILAWLVSYLYAYWLWRVRPFSWVLQIPDFSGRWEGWYWNTLGRKWEPATHEITQRAFDVSANGWGPIGWSRSFCGAILADAGGQASELVYSYHNERYAGATVPHTGTCRLRCEKKGVDRLLIGTYYTDRSRDDNTFGQGGFVRLAYAGRELRGGHSFDEASWKMPRPQDVPM